MCTASGRAKVTDGDGIKVRGYCVRLAGLDAPEWNQTAKHRFGFCFNQGKRVKRNSKPGIRGLLMAVSGVFDDLAAGMAEEDLLRDFPHLTRGVIRACLAFAADRERLLAAAGGR